MAIYVDIGVKISFLWVHDEIDEHLRHIQMFALARRQNIDLHMFWVSILANDKMKYDLVNIYLNVVYFPIFFFLSKLRSAFHCCSFLAIGATKMFSILLFPWKN